MEAKEIKQMMEASAEDFHLAVAVLKANGRFRYWFDGYEAKMLTGTVFRGIGSLHVIKTGKKTWHWANRFLEVSEPVPHSDPWSQLEKMIKLYDDEMEKIDNDG